ncbi:MAG: hypothetical protein OXQ90_21175 [Gammaproteobacteria bacterium]|nr:hypothetical protein [Gammaproteobacteria bacterium]
MKRVLLATVSALVVATVAFVAFILPAEFGIDPTGVGRALGLTGLGGSPPQDLHRTDTRLVQDFREFELAPFESVELKYDLAADDGFVYAWRATGEVVFDIHAEPEGAAPGVAESFAQGRDTADAGTYVARFAGIHGWFWENRGATTVTVRVRTTGFVTSATRYHDGMAQPLEMP